MSGLSGNSALQAMTPNSPQRVRVLLCTPDGRRSERLCSSDQVAALTQQAAAQGLQVFEIQSSIQLDHTHRSSDGRFPLLLFSQQLLALLDSGLTLTEAMRTLLAKEASRSVADILRQLDKALAEGLSFSTALAQQSSVFPEVYVATVKAAERTGGLSEALSRYVAYQQQFEELRKKLISAAIYPAMLLLVGGFVTFFLLGYVVPKFSAVYESAGRQLPWMSEMLLRFGMGIRHYGVEAGVALLITLAGAIAVGRSSWGRSKFLLVLAGLPWLVNQFQTFRLARFYRGLGLLLTSGIALPQAMSMVSGLLGRINDSAIRGATDLVLSGSSLSHALTANKLSTPVADSLIKVGERSGQLAAMLERTAQFHDDEFARWVDWASRLLEPLLMVGIGLIIGTVVVLLYIPIFELAGSLQ